MSASQRILSSLSPSSSSSSLALLKFRHLLFLRSSPSYATLPRSFSFSFSFSSPMYRNKHTDNHKEQKWREKSKPELLAADKEVSSASSVEAVTKRLDGLSVSGSSGPVNASVVQTGLIGNVHQGNQQGQKTIWKPKSYGTASEVTAVEVEKKPVDKTVVLNSGSGVGQTSLTQRNSIGLSKFFKGNLLESFTVDNSTYAEAQIRATFYPKFENEKSDQEVRTRMIEMVSKGLATMEVSLKHSGSLFMYAGNEGGAYAKNSFGNIYTAVGVFVLGRMFQQAWGAEAAKKQAEFNEYLERNRMCISMELVTAVLGDHGQRPREDYVVVTAVTELGNGKPKFYSTPDIIAFCRNWRLPTNHIWLFSTRIKSDTDLLAVSINNFRKEKITEKICPHLSAAPHSI